jgi:hypothetical protein
VLPEEAVIPLDSRTLWLFGVPDSIPETEKLVGTRYAPDSQEWVTRREAVWSLGQELQRLSAGLGRWSFAPHVRLKKGAFQPADVPALRFLSGVTSMHMLDDINGAPRQTFSSFDEFLGANAVCLGLAEWSVTSPAFLIPDAVAPTLVEGNALDPELTEALTLPYPRLTVWFSTPMVVDLDRLNLRLKIVNDYVQADTSLPTTLPYAAGMALLGGAQDVSVIGLCLAAGAHGGLGDAFCWILSMDLTDPDDPDDNGDPVIYTVPASLTVTPLADLVRLVAASLTWGRWNQRQDIPAGLTGKALRSHLRDGKNRKAASTGRLNPGVHVLDVARTVRAGGEAPARGKSAAEESGRSVSPHLRRAHWRRARCGPRTDWHYEGRLIAPTLVGGEARPDPGRVYRLPVPQAALNLPALDETALPRPDVG